MLNDIWEDDRSSNFLLHSISRFKTEIIDIKRSNVKKNINYLLGANKTVNVCLENGQLLKSFILNEKPSCFVIDDIDSKIAVGLTNGQIALIYLRDKSSSKNSNVNNKNLNSHIDRYQNYQIIELSIHKERVNTIVFVSEENCFITASDDLSIAIWDSKGNITHREKNLKSAYKKLIIINRKEIQDSFVKDANKDVKQFKAFLKIINKSNTQNELICIKRKKKVKKIKKNKPIYLRDLLNYINPLTKEDNQKGELLDEKTIKELNDLREKNKKLQTINSKLLDICIELDRDAQE